MSVFERPILIAEKVLVEKFGKAFIARKFKTGDKTYDYYVFGGEAAVIIFSLTEKKEVIAIRQFRHGANDFVLEIPGGVVENSEQPKEDVERELLEETGYGVKKEKIFFAKTPIWVDPASVTVPLYPVVALDCYRAKKQELEEHEIIEVVLIPLGKWLKMVKTGEVCDSKTLAVTFWALTYLERV